MFTKKDVASYYDSTQIHYQKWWKLEESLSLHYGIWDKETSNFAASLANTNKILMELSNISASDKILDMGCGVGGAAIFLAENKNAEVTGITLSEKQLSLAKRMTKKKGLDNKLSFFLMDYTKTSFEDESFDVVWACESMSSATNKSLFIDEAFRVLKKGGRLILSDFFLTNENQVDTNLWIKKWANTWSISGFTSSNYFITMLRTKGFDVVKTYDYTEKIRKSAKRMYNASILGALPSVMYNLLHPNVSRFAKTHYKSGYYQYKALKANLWKYKIVLSVK